MTGESSGDNAHPRWATRTIQLLPPHGYFVVSAVFHYLGPAFAVLLFASVPVLGVVGLRIASAAILFAAWRRPWRRWRTWPWRQRRLVLALGVVLGAMNTVFYLAIERLPLGTVGVIEFLGPIALTAIGLRTGRNLLALALAVSGVWLLADVRLAGEPVGFALAFANCLLFTLYVVLGHRIAQGRDGQAIDGLAAAMLVALVTVMPLAMGGIADAARDPRLLLAGVAVGLCSSVIPYVCDQLAMAQLPRATFALLLALLPAIAVVVGVIVLHQLPAPAEIAGVFLIIGGVAVHRPADLAESAHAE
ncbi:MAG: EamA family transporter [Chloroflexota bacterium]|nr:EamA family transporter [Chloroflexota bacterium]